MGFDPVAIAHLQLCARHGFGAIPAPSDVVGVSIDDVAQSFIPARHNAVSWLELALRKPLMEWLFFRTPLFGLMCWGARRHYDIWDWRVGRRLRKELFAESAYSEQWR
jgi:hypothetical protein